MSSLLLNGKVVKRLTDITKILGEIAHTLELCSRAGSDAQRFLELELEEYEAVTPMTEEEREALHEWVALGKSVHDNGWYACWDGGIPMDFLDAYRQIRDESEQ